jgi:hypothetical protein
MHLHNHCGRNLSVEPRSEFSCPFAIFRLGSFESVTSRGSLKLTWWTPLLEGSFVSVWKPKLQFPTVTSYSHECCWNPRRNATYAQNALTSLSTQCVLYHRSHGHSVLEKQTHNSKGTRGVLLLHHRCSPIRCVGIVQSQTRMYPPTWGYWRAW